MIPRRWWLTAAVLLTMACAFAPLLIVVGADAGGSTLACRPGTAPAPTVTLAGVTPTATGNAALIVQAGLALTVPTRGLVIAVAVAQQESGLMNLDHGDRDSLGIFQQRSSWASATSRMNVAESATRFYTRLLAVPYWQSMPLTVAAQAVQISGTPTVYARWETLATQLVNQLVGVIPVPACAPQQTTDATGRASLAIGWAMKQIGAMYSWGGSCTAPFAADPRLGCDCSGLVMKAAAAAGVTLPRTSEQIWFATAAKHVAGVTAANVVQSAQAGDLLFWSWGEDGIPGPGHIAMAIGAGKLIEASTFGQPIAVRPIYTAGFVGVARIF